VRKIINVYAGVCNGVAAGRRTRVAHSMAPAFRNSNLCHGVPRWSAF